MGRLSGVDIDVVAQPGGWERSKNSMAWNRTGEHSGGVFALSTYMYSPSHHHHHCHGMNNNSKQQSAVIPVSCPLGSSRRPCAFPHPVFGMPATLFAPLMANGRSPSCLSGIGGECETLQIWCGRSDTVNPMEGLTPAILPHHSSVDGHLGMRYRRALLILDESCAGWLSCDTWSIGISRRGRLHDPIPSSSPRLHRAATQGVKYLLSVCPMGSGPSSYRQLRRQRGGCLPWDRTCLGYAPTPLL